MGRRPDRVEEQRGELVGDIVGHGEQAALRRGEPLRIAAVALPADEPAGLLAAAQMRVALAAILAGAAEDRDVGDDALTMPLMAGLLDHSRDLMARNGRPAELPGPEIAAAERAGRDAHRDFLRSRHRLGELLDRDPAFTVEFRSFHPLTAPAARPPTSRF